MKNLSKKFLWSSLFKKSEPASKILVVANQHSTVVDKNSESGHKIEKVLPQNPELKRSDIHQNFSDKEQVNPNERLISNSEKISENKIINKDFKWSSLFKGTETTRKSLSVSKDFNPKLFRNELTSSEQKLSPGEYLKKWTKEQVELNKHLILKDTLPWQINLSIYSENYNHTRESINRDDHLRYVAGFDISFVKDANTACAGLFVFDLSDNMKLVYQDFDKDLIKMVLPYVPGFLGYREAPFLLTKLEKLKKEKPHLYPQCILIDGNGFLHPLNFGSACHIGLLSDTPTIGISKNLLQVFGLKNNRTHKERIQKELKYAGDYFELRSQDSKNNLLGYCYRSTNKSKNPIYVSIGHKIGWNSCLWVLKQVTGKYRIPEPIRQADLITRVYLKEKGMNLNKSVLPNKVTQRIKLSESKVTKRSVTKKNEIIIFGLENESKDTNSSKVTFLSIVRLFEEIVIDSSKILRFTYLRQNPESKISPVLVQLSPEYDRSKVISAEKDLINIPKYNKVYIQLYR